MPVRYAVSRISTYSADNFGVTSALFELGGMVVIHDPSGCNSTYTTHDEPRWYDHDSLFFISGVTELEALLGDDDKLISDVVSAAADFSPNFIVLMSSPVSLMIGTDLPAICRVIETRTGIPTFSAAPEINSMGTYDEGASWAFKLLAKEFVPPKDFMCCSWNPVIASTQAVKKPLKVNVIGVTPIDFAYNNSQISLRHFLVSHGFQVQSLWSVGSNLQEIAKANDADVTLVVSDAGLAAAEELHRRFRIPYVVGVPMGKDMGDALAEDLKIAGRQKRDFFSCATLRQKTDDSVLLIGESVYTASLAAALSREGIGATICAPLHYDADEFLSGDFHVTTEREIMEAVKGKRAVIADPLYEPIIPEGTTFIPLPHVGFSGRMYLADIPNLIDDYDAFAGKVKEALSHGHE